MRRVVAAVLTGVVAFFLLGMFVSAAEELKGEDEAETPHPSPGQASFSLEVPVEGIVQGDEVYINVKTEGQPDVYAFEFVLSYDSDLLAFKSVESEFADESDVTYRDESGTGSLTYAYSSVGEKGRAGGTLANLVFTAKAVGTAKLSLKSATLVDSRMAYTVYDAPEAGAEVAVFPKETIASPAPTPGGGGTIIVKPGTGGGGSGSSSSRPNGSGGGGGSRPSGGGGIVISGGGGSTPAPSPFPAATPTPAPLAYSDLEEVPWAQEAVRHLADKQVVTGYEDGSFRPDGAITRAEFAKLAVLAFGLEAGGTDTGFADVPAGEWYAPFVAACVRDGILNGYEDETFRPDSNITREEMAAVVVRAANFKGSDLPLTRLNQNFADENDISDFAVGSVDALYMAGAVSGDDANRFNPRAALTRAEAAKVIYEVTKS